MSGCAESERRKRDGEESGERINRAWKEVHGGDQPWEEFFGVTILRLASTRSVIGQWRRF